MCHLIISRHLVYNYQNSPWVSSYHYSRPVPVRPKIFRRSRSTKYEIHWADELLFYLLLSGTQSTPHNLGMDEINLAMQNKVKKSIIWDGNSEIGMKNQQTSKCTLVLFNFCFVHFLYFFSL